MSQNTAIKKLLKIALRSFEFRCISIIQRDTDKFGGSGR